MTKTELVDEIAKRTELSKTDVDAVISGFFDVAADSVQNGDAINVPGWMKIERATRSARTGRNPQTGETMQIAESNYPKITAGSKLKKAAKGEL